jgi:hypothetical protein
MESMTARPTLLSAAKNFMRKSAGTAVLAIAPLAAVSVAPEAIASPTTFGSPGLNISTGTSGASTSGSFTSGFYFAGSAFNNLTTTRLGVDGTFTSTSSGNADPRIHLFTAVLSSDIASSTVIPLAYDFTLTKVGIAGNVNWFLDAQIDGNSYVVLASGSLTSASATFTGAPGYTTNNHVASDGSNDFSFYLRLYYSTTAGNDLLVGMNSGSQGITINPTPIPEPSTYAVLVGLGALGLVMVRRSLRVRVA